MQRFLGTVVGTAMQKTAKVCVERLVRHAKYPKVRAGRGRPLTGG